MITDETVKAVVEQHIQGTDIFLVEVSVKPGNKIRIHVDRPHGISINECAEISRHLNEMLDREVEDYSLEVSSPGLGTPFKVKQQFEKNIGQKIEVVLIEGTRIAGELRSVSDATITLRVNGNDRTIKLEEIKTSKEIISFN